jgi:hypothetical protein
MVWVRERTIVMKYLLFNISILDTTQHKKLIIRFILYQTQLYYAFLFIDVKKIMYCYSGYYCDRDSGSVVLRGLRYA